MPPAEPHGDVVVGVTTYMEQSLAPEFQTWAQKALDALRRDEAIPLPPRTTVAEPTSAGVAFAPLSPRQALERYPNAWENPEWEDTEPDLERAVWVLKDLGAGKTRQVVATLIDKGRIRGDQLAERAGYGTCGLPPALKHIATRCRQVSRRPMWGFEKDQQGYGHYWMEEPTRAVFRRAFEIGGW